MDKFAKQTTVWAVDITEQQFKDLTDGLIPASPEEIRQVAVDMLFADDGHKEDVMRAIERCRRFLNTVAVIRDITSVFKGDDKPTRSKR